MHLSGNQQQIKHSKKKKKKKLKSSAKETKITEHLK